MPTRAQLESALKNAHAAGDTQAAKALANALKGGQYDDAQQPQSEVQAQNQPAAEAPPQERGMFQKVADVFTGNDRETPEQRALPGLLDSGILNGEDGTKAAMIAPVLLTTTNPDEITQIITSNFPNIQATYNKDAQGNVYPILVNTKTGVQTVVNKPGLDKMDLAQAGGIAAAYAPAGKGATALSVAGRSAATEGVMQGAQAASGGEFDEDEVALSAGLGGLLKGAEDVAATGYRALRGKMAGDAARLVDDAKAASIPLYTSDVKQPSNFATKTFQQTTEKIPVVGTGSLRESQQEARERAVDLIADKYGEFSYKTIVDSLKGTKDKVKKAAGSVLQSVGNKLDDVGEIGLTKTRSAIREVKDELSKPGRIRSGDAMKDLQELVDALDEAPQTFTSLKENRTAFKEIVDAVDKADRSQLTTRAKGLLEKVRSSMTSDMDDFAKSNLSLEEYGKWKRANAVYADQAAKLTKTRLKNVLDKGDMTPESVETMLFSRKPSEVRSLYNSMGQKGRESAKAAIISKVVRDLGRRQSGFTPNSFATELKKYEPQIQTFFKGADRRQLEGLRKVLDVTRRAQDAAVTTPTGQQLLGAGTVAATAYDPLTTIATATTLGTLARSLESRPVRNALIRLGSVPRGSTRFEKALSDATQALFVASQTARSETEDTRERQSARQAQFPADR